MIVKFEDAIKNIEDTDLGAFQEIWDTAIESCATIAEDCTEYQIATECRDLMTKG